MPNLITDRRWSMQLMRISLLVLLGWWGLNAFGLNWKSPSFAKQWQKTDFKRTSIDLDEILSGGPPKDGIPAIDDPKFVSFKEADRWLADSEPVISLEINGAARAYPIQILTYHEIVNDELGGIPVSITFCPLCNAAIVFERRVAGRVLDFGTTGMLRKSDLVMYDRQTESWWQQFLGEAIVGELTGTRLSILPSQMIAYGDFKRAFSSGEVQSRQTGYRRPYGSNPYQGYDRIDNVPFLLDESSDPRLPAMERVVAISHAGVDRLYPFSEIERLGVINDSVADMPLVIISKGGVNSALDASQIAQSRKIPAAAAYDRRIGDQLLTFKVVKEDVIDSETGSNWNILGHAIGGPMRGAKLKPLAGGVHFAFAWLAFKPNAEIFRTTVGKAGK